MRSTDPEKPATFGLQTTDRHSNPLGLIHGGVLGSLLDQVIALAAWNAAQTQPTVTIQLDTRFMGAARAGDLLEAQATLRHATRPMLFLDGEITSAGRPIATASAIMKISSATGQAQ